MSLCNTDEEVEVANREFEEKRKAAVETFKQTLSDSVDDFVKSAGEVVVRTVETQKKEQQKKGIEDSVKDHLVIDKSPYALLMIWSESAFSFFSRRFLSDERKSAP